MLHGNLYGDGGYISKDLRETLEKQANLNLVYKVRKNMESLDVSVSDAGLLKKRTLIESVIRELKTQMQVEHTRHRSVENFYVHVFSALIAY
ncbi:MAG: transposase [Candidatus Poribacteria bacterium]|nr:transposase [Candidatus Poribacteria bacterium]